MKKKLTNNLGLKILALFFSVILWLIVVNINDPVVAMSFSGIEVEIRNADSITSQGKVYEILEGNTKIDVVVRAKRSIIDSLSKENIRAIADMEELTFMDTVGISLSTNKYNDKLDNDHLYKVAVFQEILPEPDFHFSRLNGNGLWSCKNGIGGEIEKGNKPVAGFAYKLIKVLDINK